MPGGDVRSKVGFFVVPHRRGAQTDSQEARNHRDLVAPETRSLRLWLGRWLKGEDACMRAYSEPWPNETVMNRPKVKHAIAKVFKVGWKENQPRLCGSLDKMMVHVERTKTCIWLKR